MPLGLEHIHIYILGNPCATHALESVVKRTRPTPLPSPRAWARFHKSNERRNAHTALRSALDRRSRRSKPSTCLVDRTAAIVPQRGPRGGLKLHSGVDHGVVEALETERGDDARRGRIALCGSTATPVARHRTQIKEYDEPPGPPNGRTRAGASRAAAGGKLSTRKNDETAAASRPERAAAAVAAAAVMPGVRTVPSVPSAAVPAPLAVPERGIQGSVSALEGGLDCGSGRIGRGKWGRGAAAHQH